MTFHKALDSGRPVLHQQALASEANRKEQKGDARDASPSSNTRVIYSTEGIMTVSVTNRLAAFICLVGVLGLSLNTASAQNEPLGDEFFFFAEGSNVTIPDFGGLVVADPTNSANTVAQFNYSNWSAPGWR